MQELCLNFSSDNFPGVYQITVVMFAVNWVFLFNPRGLNKNTQLNLEQWRTDTFYHSVVEEL